MIHDYAKGPVTPCPNSRCDGAYLEKARGSDWGYCTNKDQFRIACRCLMTAPQDTPAKAYALWPVKVAT